MSDECTCWHCNPGPLTDQQLEGWSEWGHSTPQYQAAVELLESRRRTERLEALLAHVESEQEFGMERSGRDDGADGWQVYANAHGSVAERLGRILGHPYDEPWQNRVAKVMTSRCAEGRHAGCSEADCDCDCHAERARDQEALRALLTQDEAHRPRGCDHGIYTHGCPSCDRHDPEGDTP